MTEIKMDSIIVVAKEQMSRCLDDKVVILSLKKGEYYSLNPCGSRIWSLIQKPIRVGKVRDSLLEEFDIDIETCDDDLLSLLGDLHNEGLIDIEVPRPS